MAKRLSILTLAFCLILILSFGASTQATLRYAITNLGPGSGEAINDSGYVTGHLDIDDNGATYDHVFLYDGTVHDLETATQNSCGFGISSAGTIVGFGDPGALVYAGSATWTPGYVAKDISDDGWIVGYSAGGKGAVCFAGEWSEITGSSGICTRINNGNVITGLYATDGTEHAFYYNGTMNDIGTLPGYVRSSGQSINSANKITGYSDNGDLLNGRAFFYDGTMHNLGTLPDYEWAGGFGINDSDTVVGTCIKNSGAMAAFLYDGQMHNLNDLIEPDSGWVLTEAHDINNSGYITGTGWFNGMESAYVAAPVAVPELSIGEPSEASTSGGPVTFTVTYTNADTVTLSEADITLNKTGTANGTVSVTGEGTFSRTVTVSDITGCGTLGISIAEGTAENAEGVSVGAGPSNTFTTANVPTVSISRPSATSATSGPITYTVTYADATAVTLAAANITMNKTGTANGTLSVSGEGTASRTVTISNIVGYGRIGISIAAGTASNATGSALAAGPSITFLAYNPPAITISRPSVTSTTTGPASYAITYTGASAVTLTAANITLNKTGSATGTVAVSGSGLTTRTITISGISGYGRIGVSIAAGTASNTAGTAPAAGPSITVLANNPPTITISRPSVTMTTAGPVRYTVAYTGASAITLTAANITLNKTGSANGTVAVTGTGSARTVTISNVSGYGRIGISIAAGTASNSAGSSLAAGPSVTFLANNPPTITISRPSVTTTTAGPVRYTVSYVGASTITLTAAKITLNKTGSANGTVAVTGTGSARTVTISNVSGYGRIGISIAAGTASNSAGSSLAAGPSVTFLVSNPPKVTIGPPSVTSTRSGPVVYTVTYTGATTISLTSAKVVLNKTGTANGVVTVSGTGTTTRTVTISACTGTGSLGISILAGSASNAVGSAPAAGPSANCSVVNNQPRVAISAPSVSSTRTGPVTYTVTYTGATAVTLTAAKVVLNKTGTATGTVAVSGTGTATRVVTISGTSGDGTLSISLLAGTASNSGGTADAAGPSAAFTVANSGPRVTISAPSSGIAESGSASTDKVTYTVTYTSATAVTLTAANITLNRQGSANGTISVTGTGTAARTVTISNLVGDGTLGISIAAGTASNAVGAAPAAGPSATFIVYNPAPPPPPL